MTGQKLSMGGQIVLEKLNKSLVNAQAWLAENYPQYEHAFVRLVNHIERNDSDAYYGLIGILIRMEDEGERNFQERLQREYILTEEVRRVVRRIIDSTDTDMRIDAWLELKQLLSIK